MGGPERWLVDKAGRDNDPKAVQAGQGERRRELARVWSDCDQRISVSMLGSAA